MRSDPISDMLTRIRNACNVSLPKVEMPASKMKVEIAKLLLAEGYIRSYELRDEEQAKTKILRIMLKYDSEGYPVIRKIKRMSRPGLRRYSKVDNLPRILGGAGIAVVSTNKGLLTDRHCRLERVGGEVLCYVY